MKYISMKEYKQTNDYKNLIKTIDEYLESKRQQCHVNGFYTYKFVQPSRVEDIMDAYDIPFFDKFTTMYYHRCGNLILNLDVFYHQLEFFMKSLFIRIFWFNGRENNDKFAQFIWEEYCNSNDQKFIELKEKALKIYNESDTIHDFYKNFILNDDYNFIDYNEYMNMANKTFTNLDYLFIMPNLVEFPNNSICIFEDRQATKAERTLTNESTMKQLKLISIFDKLNVQSKYSFVPANKVQALKTFNFSLIMNDGMFIPQLLVFPK